MRRGENNKKKKREIEHKIRPKLVHLLLDQKHHHRD